MWQLLEVQTLLETLLEICLDQNFTKFLAMMKPSVHEMASTVTCLLCFNVYYETITLLCFYIFLGDLFLYGVWDSFAVHPLVFNH